MSTFLPGQASSRGSIISQVKRLLQFQYFSQVKSLPQIPVLDRPNASAAPTLMSFVFQAKHPWKKTKLHAEMDTQNEWFSEGPRFYRGQVVTVSLE